MFGLDSRSSCFLRVRRLLDTDRPIRTAPGALSLIGLILAAVVLLPHLRPARSETAIGQRPATAADAVPKQSGTEFDLHVVGPDGKPVAEAVVHVRTEPVPTSQWVRRGKFKRQGSYGAFLSADGEGRLVIELPRSLTALDVDITTPGYGPYWASWSSESHPEPIPSTFTAELEAGWSVGGIVVDADGKPVEGVKVTPSIEFKKRPGDLSQLGVGTNLKTDAAGKWRFDSVPASMAESLRGESIILDFKAGPPTARLAASSGSSRSGADRQDRSRPRSDGVRQSHRRGGKADRRGTRSHQVCQRYPRSEDRERRSLPIERMRATVGQNRGFRQGPGD